MSQIPNNKLSLAGTVWGEGRLGPGDPTGANAKWALDVPGRYGLG